MRLSKDLIISFLILIIIASLYRVIPGRPWGFTPQIAMAIFAGAVVQDKKYAFLLPLLSMFLSDLLYEMLFRNGIGNIPGFYGGQIMNYILFASMTVFGFFVNSRKILSILFASLAAPTAYFFLSNAVVWLSTSPNAGLHRPKTLNGLVLCIQDGLPFYPGSILGCVVFSSVLFGGHYLFVSRKSVMNYQL